jgi:formate dehydrogenase subunit gamma
MPEHQPRIDAAVRQALQRHADVEGSLMPVLQAVQAELGYVPQQAVAAVAQALNLSRAEVHGFLSFFEDLRDAPPARARLQICRAEACQALGARALEAFACAQLGIAMGEQSADGRIALEAVYCLGNCACAPSVRLGDEVYGRVTPQGLQELLAVISGSSP